VFVAQSRQRAARATLRAALLVLLAGCRASPPALAPPDQDGGVDARPIVDAGRAWADAVVAFTDGGQTTTCAGDLGGCGVAPAACAADGLLGPADGATFALGPGGTVVVAFRCTPVRATGDGVDLTLFVSVPDGGAGVVEASADGQRYEVMGALSGAATSERSFSLGATDLAEARFVRVSNTGAASLAIDALAAP
jgi:hypothetical protein